jgi:hypothetical protein
LLKLHRIIDVMTKCLPRFAFGVVSRSAIYRHPKNTNGISMSFKEECSTKAGGTDAGAELKLPVRWTGTMWWTASCLREMNLREMKHPDHHRNSR